MNLIHKRKAKTGTSRMEISDCREPVGGVNRIAPHSNYRPELRVMNT